MKNSFGTLKNEEGEDLVHPYGAPEEKPAAPDIFTIATAGLFLIALALFAANLWRGSKAETVQMVKATDNSSLTQALVVEPEFIELADFVTPPGALTNSLKINQYERTVSTLESCGDRFDAVNAAYQSNNSAEYESLVASPKPADQPVLRSDNADMPLRRNSSYVDMSMSAKNLNDKPAQEFPRQLTDEECNFLETRVSTGSQDI